MNFAAINPALMNLDMDNRIGINYGSYIAGSSLGSINYVKDLTADISFPSMLEFWTLEKHLELMNSGM